MMRLPGGRAYRASAARSTIWALDSEGRRPDNHSVGPAYPHEAPMPSHRKYLALAALPLTVALGLPALAGNWPQWRGEGGNSVSAEKGLPLEWGEGKNVVWKCPLPSDGA